MSRYNETSGNCMATAPSGGHIQPGEAAQRKTIVPEIVVDEYKTNPGSNKKQNSAVAVESIFSPGTRSLGLHLGMRNPFGRPAASYFLEVNKQPTEGEIEQGRLVELARIWDKDYKMGTIRRISRYSPVEEIIALWPELPWGEHEISYIFYQPTMAEKIVALMNYLPGSGSEWEREDERRQRLKENKARAMALLLETEDTALGQALRNMDPNTRSSKKLGVSGRAAGSKSGSRSSSTALVQEDQLEDHRFMMPGNERSGNEDRSRRKEKENETPLSSPTQPFRDSNGELLLNGQSREEDEETLARKKRQEELAQGINEKAEKARQAFITAMELKESMIPAIMEPSEEDADIARAFANEVHLDEAIHQEFAAKSRGDKLKRRPSPLHLRNSAKSNQYAQGLPSSSRQTPKPAEDLEERRIRITQQKASRARERHLAEKQEINDSHERDMMLFNAQNYHLFTSQAQVHQDMQMHAHQLQAHLAASTGSGLVPNGHHFHAGQVTALNPKASEYNQGLAVSSGGIPYGGYGTPLHVAESSIQQPLHLMANHVEPGWVQLPAVPINQNSTPHLAMFKDYRRGLEAKGEYRQY